LLENLKLRDLETALNLAVGDGALGLEIRDIELVLSVF